MQAVKQYFRLRYWTTKVLLTDKLPGSKESSRRARPACDGVTQWRMFPASPRKPLGHLWPYFAVPRRLRRAASSGVCFFRIIFFFTECSVSLERLFSERRVRDLCRTPARLRRASLTTWPRLTPFVRAPSFACSSTVRSTHVVKFTGSSTMRGLPAPTLRPPLGDIVGLPRAIW